MSMLRKTITFAVVGAPNMCLDATKGTFRRDFH